MKVLKKMLAVAVSVATMAMSVSAFAATYDADTTSVAMTAEELTAEGKVPAATTGQMTVVVVPKAFGSETMPVTADNIYYINQEEFGDAFTAIITNMGLKGALATPTDYEVRVGGANLAAPVTFDITVKGGEVTIMYGDADGNKAITTYDAVMILQKVANPDKVVEVGADANADGNITTYDAVLVLQKVANPDKVLGPSVN